MVNVLLEQAQQKGYVFVLMVKIKLILLKCSEVVMAWAEEETINI